MDKDTKVIDLCEEIFVLVRFHLIQFLQEIYLERVPTCYYLIQ